MGRRLPWSQKAAILWELHWPKIAVGLVLGASIVFPAVILSKLDSYQRTYIMAFFSLTPLQSILYAGIFVATPIMVRVVRSVVVTLREERFLVLPHPDVLTYFQRKASDYDRWLGGMRRFRRRLIDGAKS